MSGKLFQELGLRKSDELRTIKESSLSLVLELLQNVALPAFQNLLFRLRLTVNNPSGVKVR